MKKLNSLRVGVILSLLFLFCQNLSAQNFILNDDKLIDDRAKEKINQIGDEVTLKINRNGKEMDMKVTLQEQPSANN